MEKQLICDHCKKNFKIKKWRIREQNYSITKKRIHRYCSSVCSAKASGINNKGIKRSEEVKQKISRSLNGRKPSQETLLKRGAKIKESWKNPIIREKRIKGLKEKAGKWILGKHLSEETKKKISSALKGKKSYLWKGGITSKGTAIRSLFEYKIWRKLIFERDNYTCQKCGEKGKKINADHYPKSFSTIINEKNIQNIEEALNCPMLWNINNGRTLCEDCHKKTKTYLNNYSKIFTEKYICHQEA